MGIVLPRRFELGLGFALFLSPDIGTAEGVSLIMPPNSEIIQPSKAVPRGKPVSQ